MSRRDEFLRKQREKAIAEKVSQIYLSSITEVLFEAGLKKEDINYILSELSDKVANLSKGYIDLDTYIVSVEEKTGIQL